MLYGEHILKYCTYPVDIVPLSFNFNNSDI